ncbi:MAG: hypothetical protein QXI16_03385 [Sulfolobaceae archaeon]
MSINDIITSTLQAITSQQGPLYDVYLSEYQSLLQFINSEFTVPYYNTELNSQLQNIAAIWFATLRTISYAATFYDSNNSEKYLLSNGFFIAPTLDSNVQLTLKKLIPSLYKFKGTKQSIVQLIQYLYKYPQFDIVETDLTTQPELSILLTDPILSTTTSASALIPSLPASPIIAAYNAELMTSQCDSFVLFTDIDYLFYDTLLNSISFFGLQSTAFGSINFLPTIDTNQATSISGLFANDPLWQLSLSGIELNQVRLPYYQPIARYNWKDMMAAQSYLVYLTAMQLKEYFTLENTSPQTVTIPLLNINVPQSVALIFLSQLTRQLINYNRSSVPSLNTAQNDTLDFVLNPYLLQIDQTPTMIYQYLLSIFNFPTDVLNALVQYILNTNSNSYTSTDVLNYLTLATSGISYNILSQYAQIFTNLYNSSDTSLLITSLQFTLKNVLDIQQVDYNTYWTNVAYIYSLLITPTFIGETLIETIPNITLSSNIYTQILQLLSPQLYYFLTNFTLNYQTIDQFVYFYSQLLTAICNIPQATPLNVLSSDDINEVLNLINYLKPIYARPLTKSLLEYYTIDSVFPSYCPTTDSLNTTETVICYSSTYIGKYLTSNQPIVINKMQAWNNLFNLNQPNAYSDFATSNRTYLLYPREIVTGDQAEINFLESLVPTLLSTNIETEIPYSITSQYMPSLNINILSETATTITYEPVDITLPISYEISEVVLSNETTAFTNLIGYQISYTYSTLDQVITTSVPILNVSTFQQFISPETLSSLTDWFSGNRTYYARYADDLVFVISYVTFEKSTLVLNDECTIDSWFNPAYEDNLLMSIVLCSTNLIVSIDTQPEYIITAQQI